jgi:hypothetical protein
MAVTLSTPLTSESHILKGFICKPRFQMLIAAYNHLSLTRVSYRSNSMEVRLSTPLFLKGPTKRSRCSLRCRITCPRETSRREETSLDVFCSAADSGGPFLTDSTSEKNVRVAICVETLSKEKKPW